MSKLLKNIWQHNKLNCEQQNMSLLIKRAHFKVTKIQEFIF